jgi:bacillolysin
MSYPKKSGARRMRAAIVATLIATGMAFAIGSEAPLRGQERGTTADMRPSAEQRQILDSLTALDPRVSVSWNDRDGIAGSLSGRLTTPSAAPAYDIAIGFVQRTRALFNIGNLGRELQLVRQEADRRRTTHVRFAQVYNGVPVFGSELRVHVDGAGIVTSLEAEILPDISVPTRPSVPSPQALAIARADVGDRTATATSALTVFDPGRLTHAQRDDHLAWQVNLASASAGEWVYFVDALSGTIVFKYNDTHSIRDRQVHRHDFSACNLGELLYVESGPVVGDPGADATNAYNFAGDVYGYYLSTFGRDSYDAGGSRMSTAVYWDAANAEWDSNCRRTRFGTGFAVNDVVAHEWQHGVTQFTANLAYSCDPGALNESMSDVFGAMVDRDDWLMGEDLAGGYIRSLSDPPSRGQPDTTSGYNPCAEVHYNSGIPNKVAYLVSDGGTHYGVSVTGVGRGHAEQIWYQALRFHMGSSTDFAGARNATISAASELYGSESVDACSVQNAWASVGVGSRCVSMCTTCPRVAFQANNGQWVVAEGGGGGPVYANRWAVGPWETFRMVDLGGGNIALQADNGQYVVAEGGGGGVVNANRDAIGSWETFRLIDLGGGYVALQASNGQYVVAEGGGGDVVNANRNAIGPWETFFLYFP